MREYRDASNRLAIDLGDPGQHLLLELYAKRLTTDIGAVITSKIGGVEQSYWDFDFAGATLVLHYDNLMGISIFFDDGTNDELLRKIAAALLTS